MPNPGRGPSIASITPPAMAHDVPVTTSLVVEFSAVMDRASVSLSLTPSLQLASPTWSEAAPQVTFTPDAPLQLDTQYTVTVSGTDPVARKLTGDTVFTFTTGPAPETTPPGLVSSVPADAAVGVAVTSTLTLVFSERMEPGSVSLATAPPFDWGPPAWSANDTTATFTAPSPLAAATAYVLGVSGTDLAGNPLSGADVTFTTESVADTSAPAVVSTSPAAGATGISPSVQPSVSFSEAMSAATLAALSVSPDAGCTPRLDSTGTLLTCAHAGLLAASTTFTVQLAPALARDLANNPLAQPFSFSFTTGTSLDATAPALLSMTPSDAGAPRSATLVATFDEPMDKASTQGAVTLTSPAGRQLFYAWNDGGTTVSVTVDGGFQYGQAVSWSVGTGARDLAGNPLAAASSGGFTVRRLCSGALVRSDSAVDGSAFASFPAGSGTRATYGFDPGGNRARLGRVANAAGQTHSRGLYVFPLGSDTGCAMNGISRDALAVTQATLRAAQTAVTGTPYGSGSGSGVGVDWVPFEPGRADAGVLFTEPSPCRAAGCAVVLSSSSSTGHKSAKVTPMVTAAVNERRGAASYRLTLRLANARAEGLSTRSADYSDFTDGAAADGGATLEVSYEYP